MLELPSKQPSIIITRMNPNHNPFAHLSAAAMIPRTTGAAPAAPAAPAALILQNHRGDSSAELPAWFVPNQNHVICGWARQHHHHEGNVAFRRLIDQWAPKYNAAKTKLEKTRVIASVISQVQATGGFIKKDFYTKRWYQIGEQKVRDKVSHAVRKAAMRLQNKGKKLKVVKKIKKMQSANADDHPDDDDDDDDDEKQSDLSDHDSSNANDQDDDDDDHDDDFNKDEEDDIMGGNNEICSEEKPVHTKKSKDIGKAADKKSKHRIENKTSTAIIEENMVLDSSNGINERVGISSFLKPTVTTSAMRQNRQDNKSKDEKTNDIADVYDIANLSKSSSTSIDTPGRDDGFSSHNIHHGPLGLNVALSSSLRTSAGIDNATTDHSSSRLTPSQLLLLQQQQRVLLLNQQTPIQNLYSNLHASVHAAANQNYTANQATSLTGLVTPMSVFSSSSQRERLQHLEQQEEQPLQQFSLDQIYPLSSLFGATTSSGIANSSGLGQHQLRINPAALSFTASHQQPSSSLDLELALANERSLLRTRQQQASLMLLAAARQQQQQQQQQQQDHSGKNPPFDFSHLGRNNDMM